MSVSEDSLLAARDRVLHSTLFQRDWHRMFADHVADIVRPDGHHHGLYVPGVLSVLVEGHAREASKLVHRFEPEIELSYDNARSRVVDLMAVCLLALSWLAATDSETEDVPPVENPNPINDPDIRRMYGF